MESTNYPPEYPLVSVLIPTYNGDIYIKEALLSVFLQTYPNIEIVISDDGSKDNTVEMIKTLQDTGDLPHKIKLITSQINQGIAKNMNKGLEECDGKYVAILDQDDLWIDEDKLEKQVEFLEKNPEYGIIGTQRDILYKDKVRSILLPTTDLQIRKFITKFCPLQHSAVCYHKALAQGVGGYDPQYRCAMDTDLFYKILQKSQGYNLDSISTLYRLHGDNTVFLCKNQARLEGIKIRWEYKKDFPLNYPYFISQFFSLLLPNAVENTELFQKFKNYMKRDTLG